MSKRVPTSKITDFAAGHLNREESLALLAEIERDEDASRELDLVASMMEVSRREGADLFVEPGLERARVHSLFLSLVWDWLFPKFREYPALSGVVAFAVVLALLLALVPPSSPYGDFASVRDFDYGETVRGVDLPELERALGLCNRGEYEDAAKLFERQARAFPRSELADYAQYSAGAVYLRWSEWRVASFYVGYDRRRVEEGLVHLREVVRSATNRRLLEDTHWLLAKGHLMAGRIGDALDEFRYVEEMEGSRSTDAARMIRELQALNSQGD